MLKITRIRNTHMLDISHKQIRSARSYLGLNQTDLAEATGLAINVISRLELGGNNPQQKTLKTLHDFFESRDILFLDGGGFQIRQTFIKRYEGAEGFRAFLDDLYETLLHKGGEACIYNIDARHWPKWAGDKKWAEHVDRMTAIKDKMETKILIREGDNFFPAASYAEYRWMSEDKFDEETVYSYGGKLAVLDFSGQEPKIEVIKNKKASSAFQSLFNLFWENTPKLG